VIKKRRCAGYKRAGFIWDPRMKIKKYTSYDPTLTRKKVVTVKNILKKMPERNKKEGKTQAPNCWECPWQHAQ